MSPGTQIAVKGSYKNLHPTLAFFYPLFSSDENYYHHGVYLGKNKVAHFSGINKADAKTRSCDILEFMKGAVDGMLYRVEYDDPALVISTENTLRYANEAIENPVNWPGYQLIKNTCESFATWLKTGIKESAQAVISRVIRLTSPAAGSLSLSASIASHKK